MEVLESNSGDDTLGNLFDCVDVSLSLRNISFRYGGVNNDIYHHIIYGLV